MKKGLPEECIKVRCPTCDSEVKILDIHIPTTPSMRRTIKVRAICPTCPDKGGRPGQLVTLIFRKETSLI